MVLSGWINKLILSSINRPVCPIHWSTLHQGQLETLKSAINCPTKTFSFTPPPKSKESLFWIAQRVVLRVTEEELATGNGMVKDVQLGRADQDGFLKDCWIIWGGAPFRGGSILDGSTLCGVGKELLSNSTTDTSWMPIVPDWIGGIDWFGGGSGFDVVVVVVVVLADPFAGVGVGAGGIVLGASDGRGVVGGVWRMWQTAMLLSDGFTVMFRLFGPVRKIGGGGVPAPCPGPPAPGPGPPAPGPGPPAPAPGPPAPGCPATYPTTARIKKVEYILSILRNRHRSPTWAISAKNITPFQTINNIILNIQHIINI